MLLMSLMLHKIGFYNCTIIGDNDGQGCDENMRYEVINDGSKKNRTAGEQHNMTLASFASWCKEEVE